MNIHKAEIDKTSRIKNSAKVGAVKDMKSKRKATENGAGAKGRWSLIKSVKDSKSFIKTKASSIINIYMVKYGDGDSTADMSDLLPNIQSTCKKHILSHKKLSPMHHLNR